MAIIAIIMAMLLVSTHACSARDTPGLRLFSKDVIDEVIMVVHEMDAKETFSGRDISMAMFDGTKSTRELQDSERKERSILESESQETEEATKSNKDESIEDAVVMDYVTPHRKSPIHNNLH